MFILNSKQMYESECNAVNRGYTFSALMENAGNACGEIIYNDYIKNNTEKSVLILCGKGKNGGDGFVIARSLWEKNISVRIILVNGEPRDEISNENYLLLSTAGIEVYEYTENKDYDFIINSSDIIVDCIFGTGFKGILDERTSVLVNKCNNVNSVRIAVDVPSGTDCDLAIAQGTTFKPDLTIAISSLKPIHIIKPFNAICGKVKIADIGITNEDIRENEKGYYFSLNDKAVKEMLPKRKSVSNKGTYGHALCVCGSMRMIGAAFLSVSGALRMGTGLVTAAFPSAVYPALAPKLSESLMLPLDSDMEGTFSFNASFGITEAMKRATAMLIGCGLGYNNDTARLEENVLSKCNIPVVIDADGLNIISKNPDILKGIEAPVIITPHPGEMSRLTGKSIKEIIESPAEIAQEFSDKYNVYTVLKTANTVVTAPSSKKAYINTTGNSGLSKGGSGDLLAGIIVSLLAQGMKPFEAACVGVYIHGDCADSVKNKSSERGMLPTDVLNELPVYLGKYE